MYSEYQLSHIKFKKGQLTNNMFYEYLGKNGGTPLHHAIMKGNDQTVKLLLANEGT